MGVESAAPRHCHKSQLHHPAAMFERPPCRQPRGYVLHFRHRRIRRQALLYWRYEPLFNKPKPLILFDLSQAFLPNQASKSLCKGSSKCMSHCTLRRPAGLATTTINPYKNTVLKSLKRNPKPLFFRSKKVLRLRHKEVFDLPPSAVVGEVLQGSCTLYAPSFFLHYSIVTISTASRCGTRKRSRT